MAPCTYLRSNTAVGVMTKHGQSVIPRADGRCSSQPISPRKTVQLEYLTCWSIRTRPLTHTYGHLKGLSCPNFLPPLVSVLEPFDQALRNWPQPVSDFSLDTGVTHLPIHLLPPLRIFLVYCAHVYVVLAWLLTVPVQSGESVHGSCVWCSKHRVCFTCCCTDTCAR